MNSRVDPPPGDRRQPSFFGSGVSMRPLVRPITDRLAPPARRVPPLTAGLVVWGLGAAGTLVAQAAAPLPPPAALKRLSVEELSQVEVESVSRRPEKLSEAASAIQVIAGEEIRRSGAGSLPEAL